MLPIACRVQVPVPFLNAMDLSSSSLISIACVMTYELYLDRVYLNLTGKNCLGKDDLVQVHVSFFDDYVFIESRPEVEGWNLSPEVQNLVKD